MTPILIDTVVRRDDADAVSIVETPTNELIVKECDFCLAWYGFHPATLLYLSEE